MPQDEQLLTRILVNKAIQRQRDESKFCLGITTAKKAKTIGQA